MSELDTLLESGFQEAANRETFARQIEAKIKEIPGAAVRQEYLDCCREVFKLIKASNK